MKVGDLVKFTREHSERSGLEYCATWVGVVGERTPTKTEILWTYPDHGGGAGHFIASYKHTHTDVVEILEVISESR